MDKPRRRIVFNLDLQADSWEAVSHALYNLSIQVSGGQCRQGVVSGGYDSGYIVTASEDESVTHDSYFEQLDAYLAAERAGKDRR